MVIGLDSDGRLFCNQRYGDWPVCPAKGRIPGGNLNGCSELREEKQRLLPAEKGMNLKA